MATDGGPLAPFGSGTDGLTLVKTSWIHSDFTLQASDGRVVAHLDYGLTGSASGYTADGSWKLSRPKGVFRPHIEVSDLATGTRVADVDLRVWSRGGSVQLAGATYEVSATGMFKARWSLRREGTEIVTVAETGSLGATKARLTVSRDDEHAPLLVLLVVHAMVSHERQSQGGAVAAVAGGG